MNIKSLFQKYIVPHEINFVDMLQEQAVAIDNMINDLYNCFIKRTINSCEAITQDVHNTKLLKEKNMNQLLNAFITPIDRESIYRAVTGLDRIAISVKHFVLETKAYKIDSLQEYKHILHHIQKGSGKLKDGFEALDKNDHPKVSRLADEVRHISDKISQDYIKEMVKISHSKDIQYMFKHREILVQLKQIGHHLHDAANTLQDIIVKMD
ncbi:MAG: DUF47 family protein [Arcobacteraceae bacterium]|jgi:uncharacterized protein Yka (UPF0111/DUF47 family)|nr:DUF47 family protein [Arcobacteraceae bacterium]